MKTSVTKLSPSEGQIILWKAGYGRIPTHTELAIRGINSSESLLCVLCFKEPESMDHLLCHCEVVSKIWKMWCFMWNVQLVFPEKVKDLIVV
ncbi:hypothetical protein GQ457_11G022470 [Hibiscus cannabinus]